MAKPRHKSSDSDDSILSVPNLTINEPTTIEDTSFKPGTFLEFTLYFLLSQLFGPFSYFFFLKFMKNGYVLARNLHIFGGWKEIVRSLLWLAKIYCFVVTYTVGLLDGSSKNDEGHPFESRSQFWLVIYTDIALSVLHGGYYSSFPENEIHKFKTEVYDPGHNIVNRIIQLIRDEKTRAFDKNIILSRFPEIDVNNFYFVYPSKYEDVIPIELDPHPVNDLPYLKRMHITNGLVVDGDKYGEYITTKGGYQHLNINVLAIQVLSRVLVFIIVLLPVAQNIEKLLSNSQSVQAGYLTLFIIQEIFYCYFIFKFAEIYDVLFMGLLLYYRKLRLLRILKQLIDVRPQTSQSELLKVIPTVPQNIENWLNLRKILAGMNQQAFVVIDINTSFTLLYTILFIGFYAMYAVNLLTELLAPLGQFLSENSILQAAIFFTIIIVVIVLIIHLVLGILINLLFTAERKEWTLQSEIMRSIKISQHIYSDWKHERNIEDIIEGDEYIERVSNVHSLIGSHFKEHFDAYIKRLRDSVLLVLDGLTYEENINPHTLLAIKTTPKLAVSVITFISAVGLTTINDIINQAN